MDTKQEIELISIPLGGLIFQKVIIFYRDGQGQKKISKGIISKKKDLNLVIEKHLKCGYKIINFLVKGSFLEGN